MKKQKNRFACEHCRGAQYVLAYWLEKMLEQQGMHLTDIPPDVFKMIPVEDLMFCHCNIRLALFKRNKLDACFECKGTTWCFTEAAEREGYREKNVSNLTLDEIRTLPCEYFERCPCGYEDQGPKSLERKNVLKNVLDLLDIKINLPRPSFSF